MSEAAQARGARVLQARPAAARALRYWPWLAALSFIGLLATAIAHTFNYKRDFFIPAAEVETVEAVRTTALAGAQA